MNKVLKVLFQIGGDIIYIIVTGAVAAVLTFIDGFHMEVPGGENNVNVLYPYRDSTFSEAVAGVVIYASTIMIIIAFQIKRLSLKHTIFTFIGLGASVTTWLMFVQGGKIYAGRPRPNMYALVAQGKEKDAWKSFPSGHSAASFCGYTYLSLYIAGELRIFSDRPELWRMIPVIIPMFLAGIIVLTRTRDYYHNFSDVLAGSIIGILSACIGYFSKFESLFSPKAGEIRFTCRNHKKNNKDISDEEMAEMS
ncbi:hypothetical protein ENUP19_0071G0040 [Entamoeba nuttalli]|uniref:Lipid phosphate phosphatase, putative n=2 Tax=Entamoeba nuttalli TaxID=412467 RepID=K2H6F1_ENTNP|nr:lipid phosphate phosphatase, putative [Entamoeba nuttalli P19]EKE42072.1 lipid phosphate phosphatase, putative [Entamoeba nuttalli P19]|eukprot:XP_008855590.1 lipid phosphate phosphatase, putative [Entamoeba nuttalli P19]